MGFWGIELYQNDTSLDVKEQFEDQLRKGKGAEEATAELIKDYGGIEDDLCEECAFWFALADTQWTWGVLLPYVKERALLLLEKGGDLEQWKHEKPVIQLQRKRILYDLQCNLMSPQPSPKKPIKRRIYRCEWKVGDVFAYRLESDLAKEKGLFGRYFLIQKVDEGVWHPGHIVPIVYIKITKDEKLPTNVEEYNQLEYVQMCFTRYENRFWPIDGRRPREDVAEKEKINYEVDEYGLLPHFRVVLLNTSKKVIPSNLVYVGNFSDMRLPDREFIPHSKLSLRAVSWKKFDETFESTTIRNYCNHNLRELPIYSEGKKESNDISFTDIMIEMLEKGRT